MFSLRSCRRFSSYDMRHCVLGAGRWLQSVAWPWGKRHYGYSKRRLLLSQRHSSVTCQDMTRCRDHDFLFLQTGRKARSIGVLWPCFWCPVRVITLAAPKEIMNWGTAVAQWLRCCATIRKVAGSIPDGVIGIFHWHNPPDHTMALPVRKADKLTTFLCRCHEIWEH